MKSANEKTEFIVCISVQLKIYPETVVMFRVDSIQNLHLKQSWKTTLNSPPSPLKSKDPCDVIFIAYAQRHGLNNRVTK